MKDWKLTKAQRGVLTLKIIFLEGITGKYCKNEEHGSIAAAILHGGKRYTERFKNHNSSSLKFDWDAFFFDWDGF